MRWVWERGSPLPPLGPGGSQPRQWTLGQVGCAHATRVTARRVLSPARISFQLGRWVAQAGPQGHPGHPGTLSSLPAKCCVSSVGVDLRYHLVAALPPLSPAQSVSPQPAPLPKPGGRSHPRDQDQGDLPGFVPGRLWLAGLGGWWQLSPRKPPAPRGGSRGLGGSGVLWGRSGGTGIEGRGG